jgi:citrate lyase subunit beta/citryl-CoA lyase
MLFVPADSERKLVRAASTAADAVVLDLEDSVLPHNKPKARGMAHEYLASSPDRGRLWVRVNDLASGELLKDLTAVVRDGPAGLVLPKIRGPEDVSTVRNYLEVLEALFGLQSPVLLSVLVTETPSALLRLGEFVSQPQPRVRALMWGAEDLSSAMGAGDPRTAEGSWRPVYEGARSQCLLAAHALGTEAIDTVYVDFRDAEGLRRAARAARHDGFTGKVAIHPDQIPVINDAFSPTEAELALARRIVAAFDGGSGSVNIDGKMYDIPHLRAAQRRLDLATTWHEAATATATATAPA